MAQEFSELYDMQQLINFPTRGENTLDLVLSDIDGVALAAPGFGNSDHVSPRLSFKVGEQVPSTSITHQVWDWHSAPWTHIKGAVKREFADWVPSGSVDGAEADMDDRINKVLCNYLKKKSPAVTGPTPWWNHPCEMAFAKKAVCFMQRISKPDEYKDALKRARGVQKRAYHAHQTKIKMRLANSGNDDSDFWHLCKEIAGLDCEKGAAVPDVQDCADHFANKMSNGKEIEYDEDFKPEDDFKVRISSFKIRRKNVLVALKKMDPKKSANGISPRFSKECAVIMEPYVTLLFKYIAKMSTYVYRWKTGRITALHKKGSVKESSNYRPVQVLENISVGFEDSVCDQLYSWITKFIPDSQFGFPKRLGLTLTVVRLPSRCNHV